ncbi:MAG: family 20 glycosylhydrolase, partial [Verrucomicrobia bacterium]|nr:family 20 glycosylhydrolase [Verrucomicrobiota bacterium]
MMRIIHYALMLLLSLAATQLMKAEEVTPLKPGERFDYSKYAFQPKSWEERGLSLQLIPWTGTKVIFLTTDNTLDPGLMGLWVSRLDAGWQLYGNLTGRMPSPLRQFEGKVTIAAVPAYELTCGAGCGYVGATGIELAMFYDSNYPELKTHPQAMPHYVFYEMGRNFYTFGDRHSCFITGFAVFMRYVCMDALKCEDTDAGTRKVIEGVEPLFPTSGLTFLDLFTTIGAGEKVSRIKDKNGRLIEPSDQPVRYASAMLRLRRENGGDVWVQRFFHELASCPKFNPDTKEGALNQSWYWLLCSSVAAQKDLSPVFAGEWKLPIADETRAALGRIDWKKKDLALKDVVETVTPVWKGQDTLPKTSAAGDALQLVPLPKMLTTGQGSLTFTASSRILATSKEAVPLARILADEIFLTIGIRLATGSGKGAPGDVVLRVDPGMKGEAYTLEVTDTVTVNGGNYQSLASGTVTLLQALRVADGVLVIPGLKIEDEPAYPYRGALIDLARKYHSPGGIEQVIELGRLYKIRYLHLHLTDDQLFMFPSTQFPQAGRSNQEFAR